MKNIAILSVVLVLVVAGVANSATTTVSYQVAASGDDGFAQSAAVQDTTSAFLKIGDERTYAVPYQMSGMRFNNVNIPRSATITSAYLKITSINTDYRGQIYGVIAAEASDNPADFTGRMIDNAALTAASVVWDYKTAWSPDTQYISGDISNVIQEVVSRGGFSSGNSIAIYYSTRDLSGKARSFASYEYSPSSAAVLEITYETFTISGTVLTTDSSPVADVSITTDGNIEDTITDVNGYYELKVPSGWNGTVFSERPGWVITPESISLNNITTDTPNQNFIANYTGKIIVNANGSGDYPTIQSAIDVAMNGYVVELQAGTYIGNGNRDVDFRGKAITVRGATGVPDDVIIDCQGTSADKHRGFKFVSGEDANSVLEGLTITNGYGPKIVLSGGNTFSYGGGILCVSSSPTIQNCTIASNSADHAGGGIGNTSHSRPTIQNCTITGNSAGHAGGIDNNGSSPIIRNCVITDNSGGYYGGAIHGAGSSSTIQDCTITGNHASYYGGGICHEANSSSTIQNCIITGNSARDGGGIYNRESSPTIQNCVITGNSASASGGGIHNFINCSPIIQNCTITGNTAYRGGGIRNDEASNSTIRNCIVWTNTPAQQFYGSGFSVSYSNIQGGYTGTGNINLDPLFEADGYHLSFNSPCLNAGDPNYISDVNETDVDGDQRIVGTRIDMGADEFATDLPFIFMSDYNDFNFTILEARENPTPQNITFNNFGLTDLNWSANTNVSWLDVNPMFGSLNHEQTAHIDFAIDINNLQAGQYHGHITISDPQAINSPKIIDVNLTIIGPSLEISQNTFSFEASKETLDPLPQTLTISNITGGGTLDWTISPDCNWIAVYPNTGAITEGFMDVMLDIDQNNIEYGNHTCQLIVDALDANNSPQYVDVILDVLRPRIIFTPRTFYFETWLNEPNEVGQTLAIENIGYDTLHWEINIPDEYNWLKASAYSGQTDANEVNEVILSIDHNEAEAGYYDFQITVSDPNAEFSPMHVFVRARVSMNKGELHVPNEYPTIQAAIDAAVDGDEVILESGRYTGPGNYDIDFGGKAITVRSIEPNNSAVVAATIIDPNRAGPGFYFHSGEDTNSVVDGLTITQGWSPVGGGICCRYSSPTIRNCIIRDCFAISHGGGIGLEDSNSTISNCIVTGNSTSEIGGGIACVWGGNPIIENCVITGNTVGWAGGGIGCSGCNLTVRNCTLSGNKAESDFGGIGGAFCLWGATADVNNTILWSNDANDGPEIAMFDSDPPSMITVSYCDVEGGKSAVHVDPCCTLNWDDGNNLDVDPCFAEAGFWHPNDTPLDANDDFWVQGDYHLKSQAGRWKPSIYIGLDPTGDGFIDLSDFAAFANFWCEKGGSLPADLDNSSLVDFADLSLLLDNYLMSYSLGEWVFDDATSPCIDAGDPDSDWTAELWPHGKRINMGAYGGTPQASMSLSTIGNKADLNSDGIVNAEDLVLFVEVWLVDDLLLAENINRNGLVNFSDWAEFAGQWLWEE